MTTPEYKTLSELQEVAKETAKSHGHILGDWKTGGNSHNYGFYTGSSPDTWGHVSCVLCKESFFVDKYDMNKQTIDSSPCVMNPNGRLKEDDSIDGFGVTTWGFCYICGRKLSTRFAMLRGSCNDGGCNANKERLNKSNKFYNLSKLPKETNKPGVWPIFNHVLVTVFDGQMICAMMIYDKESDNYVFCDSINIMCVKGDCQIAVPRNVFVDLMQNIDKDDVTLMDESNMTMVITGKNFKNVIKGLSVDEFPPINK